MQRIPGRNQRGSGVQRSGSRSHYTIQPHPRPHPRSKPRSKPKNIRKKTKMKNKK